MVWERFCQNLEHVIRRHFIKLLRMLSTVPDNERLHIGRSPMRADAERSPLAAKLVGSDFDRAFRWRYLAIVNVLGDGIYRSSIDGRLTSCDTTSDVARATCS